MILPIGERLDEACVATLRDGIARATGVIVIAGRAEQFCLGMDFASIDERDQRPRLARFADLVLALAAAPFPTLALVDGPALGGGLGIAATCDMVIATDRARFGLPEALYGLAPAIIRPVLLGRLTPAALRLLLVTCHSRSAVEAQLLGLVDRVVAVDQLDAARIHAVRQLRRASRDTIATMRRWDAGALEQAVHAGVRETAAALARPEVRRALEEPAWL